jgi:transcription-repair coupling factor (superfamily II helicase)
MLADYQVPAAPIDRGEDAHAAPILVAVGHLSKGFRLPGAALQLWAETDVFDEERVTHERRRSAAKTFLSDFRDLKVGDLVVHVDNGIGVFVGLKKIAVGLESQEFMELRYAGEDKLFVPVERLDLVQKYTGASRPALDKLGGTTWEKAKTRVKKAMRDMAEELLKLYASRKAVPGHAFSADSHWQQEFEDAFEWDLTLDQANAVTDIKRDMESPTPMDRLLCGDVGYGKTEVAMRAAFKAVMDGKQVAILAPTTVLAFQHERTLKERFAAFPVRIDMVSRFRTKAEQKATLEDLEAGKVEIIVGTHRLLSKDVKFRDLGLLVVDEEQRFGVAHKERIKQIKKRVDVLTMTATPIPRTLNMSLAGIRDMSIIETPPKDRLSIQTNVVKFDQEVMRRAIGNELERGGQVYFVHNRVESIYSMADLLHRLVPQATIGVGHGQMSEEDLEKVMVDFMAHKYDVLLATTIIENGLDIPNANTMIINRADRYGLAQLYQLRGRVGRSDRRAYAYLLIPPEDNLSPVAKKRLAAIREFSDLGSGFRVAALDLEIRGAGNLLGGEQSGQIEAVGFDMYMKLLEQTIKELKGEEIEDENRATVNLRVDLRIDDTYIPDMNQRLTIYRRMAGVRSEDELRKVIEEARDRYGPPPASIENLAEYAFIRLLADRVGVESIDREAHLVVLKFRPEAKLDPTWLFKVVQERKDIQLTPPATLRLDMRIGEDRKASRAGRAGSPSKASWWTVRATAGEVTGGFTRDEILRPATEDPRAEGGVFSRVSGLLRDLSEGVRIR